VSAQTNEKSTASGEQPRSHLARGVLKAVAVGETASTQLTTRVPREALPTIVVPQEAISYDVPRERFGSPIGTEIPVLAAQWNEFWGDVEA
jgi:hypothetical protein